MTVQDIDIAYAIWVKNILALKWTTTGKKPIHVIGDIVTFTKEIIKLHKELFITTYILFLNVIPFLISLGQNITFTVVSHI